MTKSQDVLDFWQSIGREGWFKRDASVDETIRTRFGALHDEASAHQLDHWIDAPDQALALIIVLDQFSRNMFREDPRAFAQDDHACQMAATALDAGHDKAVSQELRAFFYMPFMHSEKIADQEHCVRLFHAADNPDSLKFAIIHRDIIRRFGRFPYRNPALGRHMTRAEQEFLDAGGFSA